MERKTSFLPNPKHKFVETRRAASYFIDRRAASLQCTTTHAIVAEGRTPPNGLGAAKSVLGNVIVNADYLLEIASLSFIFQKKSALIRVIRVIRVLYESSAIAEAGRP